MIKISGVLPLLVLLMFLAGSALAESVENIGGIEIVSDNNSSVVGLPVGVAVAQQNGSVLMWYRPLTSGTKTNVDMGSYDWRFFDNAAAVVLTPVNSTVVNLDNYNATKKVFPGGLTVLTREGASMLVFDCGIEIMMPFNSMAEAFAVEWQINAEVILEDGETVTHNNASLVRMVNSQVVLANMGIAA